MPIYLYSCGKCGKEVETLQSFSAEPPLCCDEAMKRLPTCPAKIEMKGSPHSKGYKEGYAKDYRRRLEMAKS